MASLQGYVDRQSSCWRFITTMIDVLLYFVRARSSYLARWPGNCGAFHAISRNDIMGPIVLLFQSGRDGRIRPKIQRSPFRLEGKSI